MRKRPTKRRKARAKTGLGMADLPRSLLAPQTVPDLPPIRGLEIGTRAVGIKYVTREDLTVLRAVEGSSVAGVFTQNRCPGAPVDWSREALARQSEGAPKLVVVTAGNSNVFTGRKGRETVEATAGAVAKRFGGLAEGVFVASTGVIGEPLPFAPIVEGLEEIELSPDGWASAAEAILTTDTYPKLATRTCEIGGETVTINGIVKGSGMIAPDMATMLAFVGTDAAIGQEALQALLHEAVAGSFNAITVDSDTSTSDTVLLIATHQAGPSVQRADAPELAGFRAALSDLMLDLALQVVRDGEGATKFVTVEVTGAVSDASARTVAMSVANSPLVKTAIAGEDANWGRIVMAVGKAGEPADRDRLSVRIGPHVLAEKGELAVGYREEDGANYMKGSEIVVGVDLGMGEAAFTAYTCDLTHGYISINADYRS